MVIFESMSTAITQISDRDIENSRGNLKATKAAEEMYYMIRFVA